MKVLIIGLGSIAAKHIVALRKVHPECRIVAFRSSLSSISIEGVEDVFSWDEAFANGPFNFAIVSNPTSEHGNTIRELIPFNCPLFIEKPVLDSLDNAKSLETLIANNQTLTYVACNLRFHACIDFLKTYLSIKKPVIQEVNIYCGSYLPDWRPGRNFRKLYSANIEMGGGVHLDLIHELDYCYWLFGKPVRVNRLLRNKSSLRISSTDYANYSVIYENFVVSVILNYYRIDSKRTCEIVFGDDIWEVNLLENSIESKVSGTIFKAESTIQDTYQMQMDYFLSCIKSRTYPMNDFHASCEVLNICIGNE